MQKVSDLMHTGDALPLVKEDATMQNVILTMSAKLLGCVGVISPDGKLIGIITDGDLRRNMSNDIMNKTAADIMTKNPKITDGDTLVAEALKIMNTTGKGITQLFVTENGFPVGIIHMHDCLKTGAA